MSSFILPLSQLVHRLFTTMAAAAPPSRAAVFRAISESRRSCNRFQPGRTVPREILKDVLETSLVRARAAAFGNMCC
jgi:hypothetical protein